jgi:predicted secreted hydrolase
MTIALWLVGGLVSLLFVIAGGVKMFAPKRWLVSRGLRWVENVPSVWVRTIGALEVLGAVGIVVGLLAQDQYGPLAWWLIAAAALALTLGMVIAVIVRLRGRQALTTPAVRGALAAATVVIASLLASAWPGGVLPPAVPVPANPLWTQDTKPDPVPAANVVLSLPTDMYRHKNAPTEWWWHIGTLRAGDRVFGFEINAASFVGQSFAMTQVSLSDVEGEQHYEHTQIYVPKPIGNFDVANWAEGDPSKDWYARLGDASWPVGGFNITDGGSGYTSAPTVTIEGDGSGASGLAVLDANGGVGQLVLLQPGTGYTETPTVTLTGGGGSGATAVAVRNAISMTAPQADPSQDIVVTSVFTDADTGSEVTFDLTLSQQGRPFYVFGTGIEPSATTQSMTEDNYYFSYTRLEASGTITLDGETFEVSGTTWMDHEYGYFGGSSADARVRWLLQDLQLDNGYTISNAGIIGEGFKPEIGVSVKAYATIQDADGELYYVASTITPVGELWVSPSTGQGYAQQFLVEIPSFDASFTVTTRLVDQEFALSGAPIYEGTAGVSGEILGEQVTGDAWIEQAF